MNVRKADTLDVDEFFRECTDVELLKSYKDTIAYRIRQIRAEERKKELDETWLYFKGLKPGDKIVAEDSWGLMALGSMTKSAWWKAGEINTVYHVQPRKRIVWVEKDVGVDTWRGCYPLSVKDLHHFKITI